MAEPEGALEIIWPPSIDHLIDEGALAPERFCDSHITAFVQDLWTEFWFSFSDVFCVYWMMLAGIPALH